MTDLWSTEPSDAYASNLYDADHRFIGAVATADARRIVAAMNNQHVELPTPARVVVKFHLSATNGKEGYEITATNDATDADRTSAVDQALKARWAARAALGLAPTLTVRHNLTELLASEVFERIKTND